MSLYIQKESTANTIKVAAQIVKEVERLKTVLPPDLNLVVTSNQVDFTKKSIENLKDSLLKGAGLIMVVLVFFLIRLNRNLLVVNKFCMTSGKIGLPILSLKNTLQRL